MSHSKENIRSLDSVQSLKLNDHAVTLLKSMHFGKIDNFDLFFQDINHGLIIFDLECVKSNVDEVNNQISEFNKLANPLSLQAFKMEQSASSLHIQIKSERFNELDGIEQFAKKIKSITSALDEFRHDLSDLKNASQAAKLKLCSGQEPFKTDLAFFTYKALLDHRNDSDRLNLLSDREDSVIVKTLNIILNDIEFREELGGVGNIGSHEAKSGSSIGMVRALKKALS